MVVGLQFLLHLLQLKVFVPKCFFFFLNMGSICIYMSVYKRQGRETVRDITELWVPVTSAGVYK